MRRGGTPPPGSWPGCTGGLLLVKPKPRRWQDTPDPFSSLADDGSIAVTCAGNLCISLQLAVGVAEARHGSVARCSSFDFLLTGKQIDRWGLDSRGYSPKSWLWYWRG